MTSACRPRQTAPRKRRRGKCRRGGNVTSRSRRRTGQIPAAGPMALRPIVADQITSHGKSCAAGTGAVSRVSLQQSRVRTKIDSDLDAAFAAVPQCNGTRPLNQILCGMHGSGKKFDRVRCAGAKAIATAAFTQLARPAALASSLQMRAGWLPSASRQRPCLTRSPAACRSR